MGPAAMIKTAYDASVPVLCGTESGFSLTPYGDWHYRELEVFVKEMGFTPLEAITAATGECGKYAGFEGQTGTITEGQFADLILVDGDPVKDVTVLGEKANIKAVYVGGREMIIEPLEPRLPIAGWRTSSYSEQILTRDVASRAKDD